ncbi:acyl carrier protein [Streptomyces triculaminicus]|uniref:acyl carrier protein n=1 Tax=Streptomyces triculaminicus TaxID=2816232 RepID=UPI0037D07BCF
MTQSTGTLSPLADLPATEVAEAVEALVVEEVKRALLMGDEDLPLDSNFFELGLTSLRLMNIRRSLEERLVLDIDTTVLFNSPTIEQLVDHLTGRLTAGQQAR